MCCPSLKSLANTENSHCALVEEEVCTLPSTSTFNGLFGNSDDDQSIFTFLFVSDPFAVGDIMVTFFNPAELFGSFTSTVIDHTVFSSSISSADIMMFLPVFLKMSPLENLTDH